MSSAGFEGLTYMTEHVTCDVSGVRHPDGRTVDVLARVQLAVKKAGGEMTLYGACDRLCDLIEFMGLSDVLRVEVGRKPE